MRINHLSLANFRNYSRLELDFSMPLTLLQGNNAQGKTNVLEAIYLLATSRSPHAIAEREMVNWLTLEEPQPFARLTAEIERAGRRQKLEIVLVPQNGEGNNGPTFRKQVKINGVAKRALNLIGLLPVVLFLPGDIDLVAGGPAGRRHYLDVALCQMGAAYCRALAEYNRVLAQRSALLRHLGEHGGDREQMRFWDERLVEHGSLILVRRQQVISSLESEAQARHLALTDGRERLRLRYLPGLDLSRLASPAGDAGEAETGAQSWNIRQVAALYTQQLRAGHEREIGAGGSLYGPHRDDIRFLVNGRDLRLYGSRGQQRTVALTLKLAEVAVMAQSLGESPLLLLDDVMSELDAERRAALLALLDGASQAICTTTDWSDFGEDFCRRAHCLQVVEGRVEPLPQEPTPKGG